MRFFLMLLPLIGFTKSQKIPIEIIYESLCPDSLNFITSQLYTSKDLIKDYFSVNFIPFGKSYNQNQVNFICQHGPQECLGNKIQSCALSQLNDLNKQIEFVNCFMNFFSIDREEECFEPNGLNETNINNCVRSNLGTRLQLDAETQQSKYKGRFRFIPTIIINNEFDQQIQDNSLIDFREVLCTFIKKINANEEKCKIDQTKHIIRL